MSSQTLKAFHYIFVLCLRLLRGHVLNIFSYFRPQLNFPVVLAEVVVHKLIVSC